MSKTLKVIKPFFVLKEGDVLEYSEKDNMYVYAKEEKFDRTGSNGETYDSTYRESLTFSPNYVQELIEEGYVSTITQNSQKFVNVFDEIDNLLNKYVADLADVNKDEEDIPMCLKVEKTTVLQNMIKVLSYLKTLKK